MPGLPDQAALGGRGQQNSVATRRSGCSARGAAAALDIIVESLGAIFVLTVEDRHIHDACAEIYSLPRGIPFVAHYQARTPQPSFVSRSIFAPLCDGARGQQYSARTRAAGDRTKTSTIKQLSSSNRE